MSSDPVLLRYERADRVMKSPSSAGHVRVLLGTPRRGHQRRHGPAVDEVGNELTRDDNLKAWAKLRGQLFVPLEHDIQRATTRVLEYAERMVGMGKGRNGADPFVIAL